MATNIQQGLASLGGFQQEGLHDTGAGDFQYQAAQIETPKADKSALHKVFDDVLATAAPMVSDYNRRKQEDANGDYLLKKAQLSNGQINQQTFNDWVNHGDVFYKDNPYARAAARKDIGLQSRSESDAKALQEMPGLIAKGTIKTRQDWDDYIKTRRADNLKANAELYNLNESDKDLLLGTATGLVDSDVHLHNAYSEHVSEQMKNTAQNNAAVRMNGIAKDSTLGANPEAHATAAIGQFNNDFKNGIYPDAGSQRKAVGDYITSLSETSGGGESIRALRGKTVNIGGEELKIEDVVGPEIMNAAEHKGDTATNRNNFQVDQQVRDDYNEVMTHPITEWDARLGQLQTKYPQYFQGGQNEITDLVQSIHQKAYAQAAQASEDAQKAKIKQDKTQATQSMISKNIDVALSSPTGFVDPSHMNVDPATMDENTKQGYNNEMTRRVNNIQANVASHRITQQEADRQFGELMRVDKGGFMTDYFNDLTNQMMGDWKQTVNSGNPDTPHFALDKVMSIYKAHPQAVRQALSGNKDADAFLTQIDTMNQNHWSYKDMVEVNKAVNALTPAQNDQIKDQLTKKQAQSTDLSGTPYQLGQQSDSVYKMVYARTGGDTDAAWQAKVDFVRNHTVFFNDGDNGSITAQTLMVNADPNSPQIVANSIQNYAEKNIEGGFSNARVELSSDGQSVIVRDTQHTGRDKVLSRADFTKLYSDEMARRKAEADKEAKSEAKIREEALRKKETPEMVQLGEVLGQNKNPKLNLNIGQ